MPFKPIQETRIIRDERPLMPDFMPPAILHREAQLKEIAEALKPAAEGKRPRSILAFGPTGTGKTTCARQVLSEFKEHSERLLPVYINCWQNNTRHAVISRIAEALGAPMPRRGIAVDEVMARVVELAKKEKRIPIIVLDEVDCLFFKGEENVFYDLTRSGEMHGIYFGLISITNDATLLARLDQRIRSSFAGIVLEFRQYSPQQLKDILRERAKLALTANGASEEAIAVCAAHAARLGGDARIAIESLLQAAREAEKANHSTIEKKDIENAFASSTAKPLVIPKEQNAGHLPARGNALQENFSEGEKAIIHILESSANKTVSSGALYEEAKKILGEITDRTLRNYLSLLEKKGVVKMETVDSRTTGASAGRTRIIKLA